jgi:hypothetical protein
VPHEQVEEALLLRHDGVKPAQHDDLIDARGADP